MAALEYEVLRASCSQLSIAVRITRQDYRGESFYKGKKSFEASNGICLRSVGHPAFNDNKIFLCGSETGDDDFIIILPHDVFKKFKIAVEEYNEAVLKTEDDIKVLEEAKKNIINHYEDFLTNIKSDMLYLGSAKTVKELMDAKRNIMYHQIDNIPIGANNCYYCVLNKFPGEEVCTKCKYAEAHGACLDNDSDYRKISQAIDNLKIAINRY